MSMPFVIRPGVCGHWEFEIQSQNHIVRSFCSQALTQACYGRVQKRKKKKKDQVVEKLLAVEVVTVYDPNSLFTVQLHLYIFLIQICIRLKSNL